MFTSISARSRSPTAAGSRGRSDREYPGGDPGVRGRSQSDDQVVLEASCGAMMIARLLGEGPVGRVVVCNAAETRAISHARVKSDRFDAAMLAKLLSAGMLKAVWVPDETTSSLRRRVARRAGLVRARTRVKNELHAVLARCLIGRPPVSDLFGKKGRVWLLEQQLPEEEAETVRSCLRHIDFLGGEITGLDQRIAQQALAFPWVRAAADNPRGRRRKPPQQ